MFKVGKVLNKRKNRIEYFIIPIKGMTKLNQAINGIRWVDRGGQSGELSAHKICKRLNNQLRSLTHDIH